MKRSYILIIALSLSCVVTIAEYQTQDSTKECVGAIVDSIYELYPHVIECRLDSASIEQYKTKGKVVLSNSENRYIPTSFTIDKNKVAGEIEINSGDDHNGAKTYEIPINLPSGMNGFQPKLSLSYNSMHGDGFLGTGWSLSGIPIITRSTKNLYFNGTVKPIELTNEDVFLLSGRPLILTKTENGLCYFESERDNIKVIGHTLGKNMRYFEVFYPDGNKGVFGNIDNKSSSLQYPISKLTDLKGNDIEYTYEHDSYNYIIKRIDYNGSHISFDYIERPDSSFSFCAGLKTKIGKLLSCCSTYVDDINTGSYNLSYRIQNSISLLEQVSYSCGDKSYNPLHFYYGTGASGAYFNKCETQLYAWHTADKNNLIRVIRGKFDYENGNDGLIEFPNLNPYIKRHVDSNWNKHSEDYFANAYQGEEKIFIYTNLSNSYTDLGPELTTGKGFVDLLCADLRGSRNENIILVNAYSKRDDDYVIFTVYGTCLGTLMKLYTRSYVFNTVFTDHVNHKTYKPRFYYTGDFDGDGKEEIFAVSAHKPFGPDDSVSKCYVFDLENDSILFEQSVFNLNIQFYGDEQPDAEAAANNSDKVFAYDFNGDGKTDICHISSEKTTVYSFEIISDRWRINKLAETSTLQRSTAYDRLILPGDYNGDGLVDLLLSPRRGNQSDKTWVIYFSTGIGTFKKTTFEGPVYSTDDNVVFQTQDVNCDGLSDLIYNDKNNIIVYFIDKACSRIQNKATGWINGDIIVPVDINSKNKFTNLASINNGVLKKLSYIVNANTESLLTGMVSSLGLVEKNNYKYMSDGNETGFYTKGNNAVFPFVNICEPCPLLESTELFANSQRLDFNHYTYQNAVAHRQGLGFCGFERYTSFNNRELSHTIVSDPFNYAVLKSEITPESEFTFNYNVNVRANKTVQITLSNKTEKDLLHGFSSHSIFSYDQYGYPIKQTISYSDGYLVTKEYEYSTNEKVADGYYLGGLMMNKTITQFGDSTYTEMSRIVSGSPQFPKLSINYINGNIIKLTSNTYDNFGNILKEDVKEYSSGWLLTSYTYDSYGRVRTMTDPLGLTETYTYNSNGNLESITDIRGLKTLYEYDALGRQRKITNPDKTYKITSYLWANEPAGAVVKIINFQNGLYSYYSSIDALGRVVQEGEIRFDRTEIKKDTQYDSFGNIAKVSLPYKECEPSLWNEYKYDIYDRLISITEPSGHVTSHSYNKNKKCSTSNNIAVTKEYDSQGNVVRISDSSGSITYNLHPDGKPSSIIAFDNIKTIFKYDQFRRLISRDDPSHGLTSYEYDNAGNISKETYATGKSISKEYDAFHRIVKTITPEFTTSYEYNSYNELVSTTSSNGTSKVLTYDSIGRVSTEKETVLDKRFLTKSYTYAAGNISSIRYTTSSGLDVLEEHEYKFGHLVKKSINGKVFYTLNKENEFGNPIEVSTTGGLTREYGYNEYGIPTFRKIRLENSDDLWHCEYDFEPETMNLRSRKDVLTGYTETFGYDNLNRLTSCNEETITYSPNGNITAKSDIGSFSYGISSKPYAISSANISGNISYSTPQTITYTSFSRPDSIKEGNHKAAFFYNGNYDRIRMIEYEDWYIKLQRTYIGGCYEFDQVGQTVRPNKKVIVSSDLPPLNPTTGLIPIEKLYIGGDYYNAPIVYIYSPSLFYKRKNGIYNIVRDYLGSITQVIDSVGNAVERLDYDAWGRLRNPDTHEYYQTDSVPSLLLGRGYTGHEHLSDFGLINMNARLYDPVVGRFLSPDPYVQEPDMTQNFNRFSYALNNPLHYVDEDGEFFLSAIGAAALIGGIVNVAAHWKSIKAIGGWKGFWKGASYFLAGGIAGAAGMAVGMHVPGFAISGFLATAPGGAIGGGVAGFIEGTSNSLIEGNSLSKSLSSGFKDSASGFVIGGIGSGVIGGFKALKNGKDFWNGRLKNSTMAQRLADIAESAVGGKGHVAGTKKHTYAKRLLKRYERRYGKTQFLPDHKKLDIETNKNCILDLFDDKHKIIYDWKFGYPNMTPEQLNNSLQMQRYRRVFESPSIIIKPKQ